MKNLIIILFLLFFYLKGFGQIAKPQINSCQAIIHWKYLDEIKVYDFPNGKIVKSLKNDSTTENYINLFIEFEQSDHFQVSLYHAMNGDTIKGWIKKEKYIGAFIKNEKDNKNLILYSKDSVEEESKTVLFDWKPSFITIIKCSDVMSKVMVSYKGKRITGWIETSKLCANNYSTCS